MDWANWNSWALFVLQIIFAIGALGKFAAFTPNRDFRNLLAAIAFGGAAVASYLLSAWWPLLAGFALLWAFKIMGLDPSDDGRRPRRLH